MAGEPRFRLRLWPAYLIAGMCLCLGGFGIFLLLHHPHHDNPPQPEPQLPTAVKVDPGGEFDSHHDTINGKIQVGGKVTSEGMKLNVPTPPPDYAAIIAQIDEYIAHQTNSVKWNSDVTNYLNATFGYAASFEFRIARTSKQKRQALLRIRSEVQSKELNR